MVIQVKRVRHKMLKKLTRQEEGVGKILSCADKGGAWVWQKLILADKEGRGGLEPHLFG